MSTGELIVTILTVGGAGALLAEIVRALLQRKNMDAGYAKTISESALALLLPLRERVTELEHDLDATEKRASEVARGASHLAEQLADSQAQCAALSTSLQAALGEVAQLRAALAAAMGHKPEGTDL